MDQGEAVRSRSEIQSIARLTAAYAVKKAAEEQLPNRIPSSDVLRIALDSAIGAGALPEEAAPIALDLQKIVDAGADPVAAVTGQLASAMESSEYSSRATQSSVGESDAGAAAKLDPIVLAPKLLELFPQKQWVPLAALASALGAPIDAVTATIYDLSRKDFVKVENDHVWLTDSGRRYLEYLLQTS
jgi:hypothetical protein